MMKKEEEVKVTLICPHRGCDKQWTVKTKKNDSKQMTDNMTEIEMVQSHIFYKHGVKGKDSTAKLLSVRL